MEVGPLRRRLGRLVITAFCGYHLAATFAVNLPVSSAFGSELRAPFNAYLLYAGVWQSWTMFETIPYFQSIHPRLVARSGPEPDARETAFDAMLPGLAPLGPRNRLVALFIRYTFPGDDLVGFVRGYLRNACEAIEARVGVRPFSVSLRLDAERLLPLSEVRARGIVGRASHDVSPVQERCE